MIRRLLHIVLALSLFLNGFSAPLAMGRMDHHHENAGMAAAHDQHAAAPMREGSHSHHRHAAAADPGVPASHDPAEEACCKTAACQCGCVPPPVVAIPIANPAVVLIAHPGFAPTAIHLVQHRHAPPLRPPAV
jgi:hypothetical protein